MSPDYRRHAIIFPRSSAERSPARAACRYPLFHLLALALAAFAFLCQIAVVQTHVHAPAGLATASDLVRNGAPARLSARGEPGDGPAMCPVCRELAQAGSYVAPGGVAVAGPAPIPYPLAPQVFALQAGRQVSHAWFSRGPPASPIP